MVNVVVVACLPAYAPAVTAASSVKATRTSTPSRRLFTFPPRLRVPPRRRIRDYRAMAAADRNARAAAIGIDVGGTKVAAAAVETSSGAVLERRRVATGPERGGAAVLADCAALAAELGGGRLPVGIALCELVDLDGRPASGDTVDWRGLDVEAAVRAPSVVVESDVRAAALERAEDVLTDPAHAAILDDAAAALGGVLATLANALDPALVVLGGGLGTAPAFRERVERALRERLAYPRDPPLPVVGSFLGVDGGAVGAALLAADVPG